ncbi:hypothetical protein BpJC7_17990 [Weizmannia acidilactici]|uniref:Uncharacterized protein n=1 Tax=Weizmannia acidilactici TaxID=2607726 RepID=A0A5J4J6E9_9BACI|nr:hypothetical protein [Weizmannia acidilactici]GER67397.1 hypothetical protein BpJC4_18680 [Weizmannia acidilactici]GER70496.1 hypothetical protein BpJC7_17990 [Weizmannia acidilactici]GER72603.1 hypothetical protein BpPP18_06700 [Weizmannia acidilactici]
MKNRDEQIFDWFNQLFKIINSKGDIGEIKQIGQKYKWKQPPKK